MKYHFGMPICIFLIGGPSHAGNQPQTSWSKPDVSYDQYRTDAIDCAKLCYYRNVSEDKPAKQFLRGFQTADDAINQVDMGGASVDKWRDSVLRTRPDQRLKELHAIQLDDVQKCLIKKGYKKFALNKTEENTLRRYAHGSKERHRYLYALASQRR